MIGLLQVGDTLILKKSESSTQIHILIMIDLRGIASLRNTNATGFSLFVQNLMYFLWNDLKKYYIPWTKASLVVLCIIIFTASWRKPINNTDN